MTVSLQVCLVLIIGKIYSFCFISPLTSANQEYSSKVESGTASEKVLYNCAWNVDDLSRLNEEGRQLLRCARELKDLSDGSEEEYVSANVALRLCDYQKKLLYFLQGTYKFRCTPATHIYVHVLMMSPEQHNRKSYALPVQCVPYASLKHKTCGKLVNDLIIEMHSRQMKVAGEVLSTYCTLCQILLLRKLSFCARFYNRWRIQLIMVQWKYTASVCSAVESNKASQNASHAFP